MERGKNNMTERELQIYDRAMKIFGGKLKEMGRHTEEFRNFLDSVADFQTRVMKEELYRFAKETPNSMAKEIIYDIWYDVIFQSLTGNVVTYIKKEMADELVDMANKAFGKFLLEQPQVYEDNGEWCLDVTFGGNYVPWWDGFSEED